MDLIFFLIMGTMAMMAVMLLCRIDYRIQIWKTVVLSVILTFAGVGGAKLMRFIEAGVFSGESFFGAVFFAPLIMLLFALLLKIPILTVLDMCAPAECIMLSLLKVNCLMQGCCAGIYINILGTDLIFPAQLAEMLNGLVLTFVLLIMMRYENNKGKIYPWYMILYGITRFILNFFRETEPFILGVAAGTFWSIISFFGGIILLIIISKKTKKINDSEILDKL